MRWFGPERFSWLTRKQQSLLMYLWFVSLLCIVAAAQTQSKPLSNDDVIQMVSLGLSDDVIIEKIQSVAATNFDTSVAGLRSLKAAKVSNSVLKAMINPHASLAGKEVDSDSNRDGKALAARAVDYMGGLWKLQSIKSVRIDSTATPPGQKSVHVETIEVFPDRIRIDEELPSGRLTAVVTPEAAFESTRDIGLQDMTAEQKMDMLHEARQDTYYVGQYLNDPAFTFAEVGTEKIGRTETRMVDVDGPGVSVRWFVEPRTGRILREAHSREGAIVKTDFDDWKTENGLTLPYFFNDGKENVQISSVQINPTVDPKIFEKPAPLREPQSASTTNDVPMVESARIRGTLTYYFNSNYGNRPDSGSKILLVAGGLDIPPQYMFYDDASQMKIKGRSDEIVLINSDTEVATKYATAKRTIADGNGNFEINDVVPGAYTLILRSNHVKTLEHRDILGRVVTIPIMISGAETLDESYDFGITTF